MKQSLLQWRWMALFAASASAGVFAAHAVYGNHRPDGHDARPARGAVVHEVALIKSRAELERYLATVPPASNALFLLSPPARERFVASVTFNESGPTGFDTTDLKRELTQAQMEKVLALFGSASSAKYIKAEP